MTGVDDVGAMRAYCLYNKMYKVRCVFAPDLDTAKAIAIAAKHVRRGAFRMVKELRPSDEGLSEREADALRRGLELGKSGMASVDDTGEWQIIEM